MSSRTLGPRGDASAPGGGGVLRPDGAELRRFALGVGFVVILLVIVQGLGYFSDRSDSPIAAGAVVMGLGLAIAVAYGVARDSSVGVLVWLTAALFSGSVGLPIDRLAFMALAGGWFLSVVTLRRPLRHFGLTEGVMVLYLLLNLGSGLAPHELDADTTIAWTTLIVDGAFLPFAVFVLARQTMADHRAIRNFLWFLVGFGLYMTLTAIFYKFGPQALVFPREILDASAGVNPERARGPLLNSAADGVAMVMAFIAAMYLGVQKEVRYRRLALSVALIMPLGIYLTQTRAVWLSAAVALVLGAMFARGFRRWYVFVLLGALTVIAVNWQKFLSADRQQGGVTSVSEIDSRLNDIATALWGIAERPIFGWGLGRFPSLNTVHHQAWGDVDWNLGFGFIGHNTHLSIGAELGLIGLALWTGIIVCLIAVSARAWRLLPATGLVSKGFVFSFWCVGFAWLLNSSVIEMRAFSFISGIAFVWAGIVAGLADRIASGEEIGGLAAIPVRPSDEPSLDIRQELERGTAVEAMAGADPAR